MRNIAALFDMDHTLTWLNSGLSSVRFARQMGLVRTSHLLLSAFKIALYRLSLLDIDEWYEKNVSMLRGTPMKNMEHFGSLWYKAAMSRAIYREALDLVVEHRGAGHTVVVISNSPPFFVRPVAEALGIAEVICTRVEELDGILTGRLIKPLCYGKGKLKYALEWADIRGIDLSQSYFYTDSFFDLPLLEAVGHPVAANPDVKLKRAAAANGWPIRRFARVSAF